MPPNPKPNSRRPEPTVATRAAQINDAMLAALLPDFQLEPEHLKLAREAFTAFCQAHPEHADVRRAWTAFHTQLQTEINQPALQTPA